MSGFLVYFGTFVVIVVGSWLLRRRSNSVDDYYERDYRDPQSSTLEGS
ncbi:MAG: hypothetical protein KJ698_01405 [Actinobacteria bacterium]|nr:hypothetical protein [Actinomycetota bacterium]MBU1494997.1 hypothetical protein [Actinomycetota bacterium]MBU1865144.1 hypothetical protein [Actinomycetota bacterium]